MLFIYLSTESSDCWALFLGKRWKIFGLTVCKSFSNDGIFSPDLSGHLLYHYQFFYIIFDCQLWMHFPHIDFTNAIIWSMSYSYSYSQLRQPPIVLPSQLTEIGIQDESVFCSRPWALLKSMLARKQGFLQCIQFYT